jgi:hypothetical protein
MKECEIVENYYYPVLNLMGSLISSRVIFISEIEA